MKLRFQKRYFLAGCLSALLGIAALAAIAFAMAMGDDEGIPRATVADTQGRSISYLHAGESASQRIIYVHGSPGNARAWLDYLKNPISGFQSIALDRPGFGQTLPAGPASTLQSQAAAIEPFLVERDGKWPILVGHSFGGTVVCQAAADYPDRVGGLVILSGALDPALERKRWYQQVGEFWFVPNLLPRPLRNSNRELIPLKGDLEELAPRLATITSPAIILHGTEDDLVPVSNVDFLQSHLPSESIREIRLFEGRNHLIPWSESEAIREAIQTVAVGS